MTILLTSFKKFGEDLTNPTEQALALLKSRWSEQIPLYTQLLDVDQNKDPKTLCELIEKYQPKVVICFGLAKGRVGVTPERIAININDYRIKDNEENQPVDVPVVDNAPLAYLSTLPVKRIVNSLRKQNLPASLSNTAGTFVCNTLFFELMHYCALNYPGIKAGFVHVCASHEQNLQGTLASLSIEDISKAMEICLITAYDFDTDVKTILGSIS